MIHWTDQIKEILNAQEMVEMKDSCGPLQEIAFWKSRSTKLSDISQQLQKPQIKHIQNILLQAKSLYVLRFCQLAKEIRVLELCSVLSLQRCNTNNIVFRIKEQN